MRRRHFLRFVITSLTGRVQFSVLGMIHFFVFVAVFCLKTFLIFFFLLHFPLVIFTTFWDARESWDFFYDILRLSVARTSTLKLKLKIMIFRLYFASIFFIVRINLKRRRSEIFQIKNRCRILCLSLNKFFINYCVHSTMFLNRWWWTVFTNTMSNR